VIDLTPQAIADWLRDRAKRYLEMADLLDQEKTANRPMIRYRRETMPEMAMNNWDSVTAELLAETVGKRAKAGRVKDLAAALHVDEETIEKLLNPASPTSRVYKDERGWIKVKDAAAKTDGK
jgi:hypothetical protein